MLCTLLSQPSWLCRWDHRVTRLHAHHVVQLSLLEWRKKPLSKHTCSLSSCVLSFARVSSSLTAQTHARLPTITAPVAEHSSVPTTTSSLPKPKKIDTFNCIVIIS